MPFSKSAARAMRGKRYGQVGQKKVLSNKALTQRVRRLDRKEGQRNLYPVTLSETGFDNVTLTAATADLNYVSNTIMVPSNSSNDYRIHYVEYWVRLLASAQATVRLLFGYDTAGTAAGTVAEILSDVDSTCSGYKDGSCISVRENNHPNKDDENRFIIQRDVAMPLIANEPRLLKVRIPFKGRKAAYNGENNTFYPFILALSNASNATITVQGHLIATDMQGA